MGARRGHPDDTSLADDADHDARDLYEQRVQEREVRLTAQRILAAHLSPGRDPDQPVDTFWDTIDLDLTGATLINLTLAGCRISTGIFSGATFTGITRLNGVTFTETALFNGATFAGIAGFDGAAFTETTEFDRATFAGIAMFRRARFTGTAGFDGATFMATVRFDRATFTGPAWFSRATFTDTAFLNGATFTETTEFDRATFKGGVSPEVARFIPPPDGHE